MNICLICKSKNRALADSMIDGGHSQAAVARRLGVDRQVVGRHVRNGHVRRGNPSAGSAWAKPEALEIEVELEGWQLLGFATEDDWLRSIADQFGVPFADLKQHFLDGHHRA